MQIEPYTAFGERIDSLLARYRKTQSWLARRLKAHPNTIANWMKGNTRPSSSDVEQIANELKCDAAELEALLDETFEFRDIPHSAR